MEITQLLRTGLQHQQRQPPGGRAAKTSTTGAKSNTTGDAGGDALLQALVNGKGFR